MNYRKSPYRGQFALGEKKKMVVRVCVIGAGIAGLSSAVAIQKQLPHADVTVIAEKFSPEVTSDVAGGYIGPHLVSPDNEPLIKRLFSETFAYVASLIGENVGALWQSGVMWNDEILPRPFWADTVRAFRDATPQELARQPAPYKQGWFYTSLALVPTLFLQHLIKQFESRGGKIQRRKIENLSEVTGDYDVVVNCAGLGSRSLLGDKEVYPIRGQIIRVRAPAVKHFFHDPQFYVLLNRDVVVLGGTHDENEWDTTVNPAIATRILTECQRRVPELKEAEIVSHHVGLRPFRGSLRLEGERVAGSNGREVLLIHNYGHGGSGISLFWGCCQEVVRILKAHLPPSHI